jgi:hypothetical protein
LTDIFAREMPPIPNRHLIVEAIYSTPSIVAIFTSDCEGSMFAQNRRAALESELKGKAAEPAPALPSRRLTPERVTSRAAAPSRAPALPAPAPAPIAPTAGDVFFDKGAATAANFRPSYWSYDHQAQQQPAATEAPVAPPQRPRVEPVSQAVQEDLAEPSAVMGMPIEPPATAASLQPVIADELAATIEHVLGSRYATGRPAQDPTPKARLVTTEVTADSLIAELSLARQSRSGESKPAPSRQSSRAPKKPMSLLDRAFALGGVALVLFALLALSPWRDSVLSPSLTHFFG